MFKFQWFLQMLTFHQDSLKLWNLLGTQRVARCPMYVLPRNIQILKSNIRVWNETKFRNMHDQIR